MSRGKNIRLHPEHGLNPTLPLCYFCGKPKNEIILAGDACRGKAPRGAVWDKVPCDECADLMQRGCMIIEVRDGEEKKGGDNPYRTGRIWVVTKEAAGRMFKQPAPVAFMEESVARGLGLHDFAGVGLEGEAGAEESTP